MTHHHRDLVPEQLWQAIQPLLPIPPRRYGGRPRVDDHAALAGIVYQLRTSVPWRRLRDWQRAGVWERLHHRLLDSLGDDGQVDWSRASIDSVSVRARRAGN